MRRVVATASGPGSGPYGYGNIGVFNALVTATMTDTTATATGSSYSNVGVLNLYPGAYELSNVTASGAGALGYGMQNRDDGLPGSIVVTADRSTFTGDTASVLGDGEFVVRIGASRLAGGAADPGGGTLICAASYDGGFQALGAKCLP